MDLAGAGRWRQGANACIFKPAVSCENEPPPEGHISRIVKVIPGVENRDVKYETILKTNFPQMVEEGLVSVYTKICKPTYVTKDSLVMPGFPKGKGACSDIVTNNSDSENQINLITPIQGETLDDKAKSSKDIGMETFNFLRPAFKAAIALVSNNSGWLINMDLHGGNILTNKNTDLGMMSDWDQSLFISPGHIEQQVNEQIPDDYPCLKGDSVEFGENYYQWWSRAVDVLKACKNGETLSHEEVNTLRVWTIRTLFFNAIFYSKSNLKAFNSKRVTIKLLGKVMNENVKQTARDNLDLLDQILLECNTPTDVSNLVEFVIEILGGGGLSQLVGGRTTRRRSKKN